MPTALDNGRRPRATSYAPSSLGCSGESPSHYAKANAAFRFGRCTRGAALEGVDGGKENSLAMTLLWFCVWLIANLIGDEEGLTFDPVNFWAGWLLLALALDLAGAHATRVAKARR